MAKRVLDTNVLINHWGDRSDGLATARFTEAQVRKWADELIILYKTKAILTPIYIEFVAGSRSPHELRLARAFLGQFHVADEGRILAEDWREARRIAERIPHDGLHRQLGDCLIRAPFATVSNHPDVITFESRFPW